jgi:hypothetical protein
MCHIVASASDADGRLATIECACGDHDAAVNALLGPLGLVAARVIVDVAIAPLHAIEGPTGTSADWLPPNTSPPPQR